MAVRAGNCGGTILASGRCLAPRTPEAAGIAAAVAREISA